jgi:hypothetical protein
MFLQVYHFILNKYSKSYFLCLWVFAMCVFVRVCVCVCVRSICVPAANGVEKRLDCLDLEIPEVVSQHVGAGNQTQIHWSSWAVSPDP